MQNRKQRKKQEEWEDEVDHENTEHSPLFVEYSAVNGCWDRDSAENSSITFAVYQICLAKSTSGGSSKDGIERLLEDLCAWSWCDMSILSFIS